uniref:Uncharacterized protein n=1 Tax=Rhizophora mucronata TaxID=61149 RepID=A0A2P2JIY5_RHIMU
MYSDCATGNSPKKKFPLSSAISLLSQSTTSSTNGSSQRGLCTSRERYLLQ